MTLLTRGNPKVLKGESQGYLTFILHLAPASLSGYNTCASATPGCKMACLNTAGRGGIPNARPVTVQGRQGTMTVSNVIQAARIRKTVWFFQDRAGFMAQLLKEIRAGIRYAQKMGLIPVFRLNGTSDIRWESVGVDGARNVMELFPDVQFYDYTKMVNRKDLPANYKLTFSLAETNDLQAFAALGAGLNVAAVFKGGLPETFMGRRVINGDESDLRFLDPVGVVVGLKAKGKAKRDTTGFVRAA
jgi:hypothetical protein